MKRFQRPPEPDYDLHEVSGSTLPDDALRVCPLIGNDEIKLCLDARGAMHDFQARPSYPPPRIVWAGRRHDHRNDRYSSNLFEWGFLDLHLAGEARLPAVTRWSQRLHPRQGYVETVTAWGAVEERTLTFVHLERNILVIHRQYRNLPLKHPRTVEAVYTFCDAEATDKPPFRTTWQTGAAWRGGIVAQTTADGLTLYKGMVALRASTAGRSSARGNTLRLRVPLDAHDAVTIYLFLSDDLGNDPQVVRSSIGTWMPPGLAEVERENQRRKIVKPDPAATIRDWRAWVTKAGFKGVFASQQQAWRRYWAGVLIELPAGEAGLRAALDTQLYTLRCSRTAYSLPPNPFNSSWGAGYFLDEAYGFEGLLALGADAIPRGILEWRRRTLPMASLMTCGRGAKYPPSANEAGRHLSDRNGTNFYHHGHIAMLVNYVRQFCAYHDDLPTLRRYYPIARECAEYFRNFILLELPGNNVMVAPGFDWDENDFPVQDGPCRSSGAAMMLAFAAVAAERLGLDRALVPEWRRLSDLALCLSRETSAVTVGDTGELATKGLAPYDYEIYDRPDPGIARDPKVRAWRAQYRRTHGPAARGEHTSASASGAPEMLPLWSWGRLCNAHFYATQGLADRALEQLRHSLDTVMAFAALNESADPGLGRVHHPWFMTAAGAFVRAVTRMLLYPRDEAVFVLPGVPAAWRDLEVELPAHGRVSVKVRVVDGHLAELTLSAAARSDKLMTVFIPKRFLPEARFAGAAARLEGEEGGNWKVAVRLAGARPVRVV